MKFAKICDLAIAEEIHRKWSSAKEPTIEATLVVNKGKEKVDYERE